ncbi:ABC transporter [Haladaptatus sp. CMAA 1909]|uniref:fluoroquinolone export ABC transporter permease subunit n=1 Tax=Haladaptatus sp. CMAA 1909 TaxID=3368986 RepID=UPI00375507A4
MTALRSMLPWDTRLQVRYGIYSVYAVLTVLFVLGVRLTDLSLRTDVAVLVIALDPTALGFYFIAALVLFEKREGVVEALVVSPLSDRGYLASKAITLSFLATLVSTLVAVLGHGATPRIVILVVGVALSASLFVSIGFVAIARFDSINEYFLTAVFWGGILFVPPLVGYVGLVESPLLYLFPTQATLLVIEAGFHPISSLNLLYGFGYLVAGNVVAYILARRAFRKHIVRGGDPGRQLGRRDVSRKGKRDDERMPFSRSPWMAMVRGDIRNWVRDPMLAIAAVGPLAMVLVLRLTLPSVTSMLSPTVDLRPYYPVSAGTIAVFGPAIYGFIVGMFVLEDRDEGVLDAYKTSPLSARGYFVYRCVTAYCFSFGTTLPAVALIGLVPASPSVIVGTTAVSSLGAPAFAFALGALASNSIEGIAISKFGNIVFIGPAFVIALVPEPHQFVVGVFPAYWAIKTFVVGVSGDSSWVLYLGIGVVVNAMAIALFGWWFAERTR